MLKKLSQIVKLRKSENDDQEVKLEAEETISEGVKLNLWKRKGKNERTGLKILTPNKI